MSKTYSALLMAVALTGLSTAMASTDELLTYTFDSLDGTPSFQASGVSGSVFDRDQDHFIAYSTTVGAPQPAAIGNAWDTDNLDTGRYFTFTLNAGAPLTLNSVSLDLMATPEAGGDGGPTHFSVRSSLDGFAADDVSGTLSSSFTTQSFSPNAVLSTGQSVEFRVFAWGTGNSGATFAADNVHVAGIAPVPEPSTAASVGLGLALLACAQRFGRRSA